MNNWDTLHTTISYQKFLYDNPVLEGIRWGRTSKEHGIYVLRQYYFLVITIVQFLTIAMARIPVQKVKDELRRNLDEELGSRTGGVSHQELLEKYVKVELGVDIRTIWNEATQYFISNLLLDFNNLSPIAVAGMIYALEATACPELLVIGELVNISVGKEVVRMTALKGKEKVDLTVNSLETFLASHTLDFELGHESGLRKTLSDYISGNWDEFENGFNQVLALMQVWWNNLARA